VSDHEGRGEPDEEGRGEPDEEGRGEPDEEAKNVYSSTAVQQLEALLQTVVHCLLVG
jgi:hypothetical protein